jgi:hypothetical protein
LHNAGRNEQAIELKNKGVTEEKGRLARLSFEIWTTKAESSIFNKGPVLLEFSRLKVLCNQLSLVRRTTCQKELLIAVAGSGLQEEIETELMNSVVEMDRLGLKQETDKMLKIMLKTFMDRGEIIKSKDLIERISK